MSAFHRQNNKEMQKILMPQQDKAELWSGVPMFTKATKAYHASKALGQRQWDSSDQDDFFFGGSNGGDSNSRSLSPDNLNPQNIRADNSAVLNLSHVSASQIGH